MAGRGSRLRQHTLTTPKPLIPVAGKPIVQRLVEDIVKVCGKEVEEIAFIIGDFGKEVEESLIKVAEGLGAKGSIYHQDAPLGTAHAILCAKESLEGNCVVAFADTLFKADLISPTLVSTSSASKSAAASQMALLAISTASTRWLLPFESIDSI